MTSAIARKIFAAAALMALGILATTRAAHATPMLQIAVGSDPAVDYTSELSYNAVTRTYNFNTGDGNYTVSGLFQVSVSITSRSSPTSAQLLDSTIDVRTNDTNDQSRELFITVTDNFSQPIGPNLTLTNSFTGSTTNETDDQLFTGEASSQDGSTLLAGDTRLLNTSTTPPIGFSNVQPFMLSGVIALTLNPGESASVGGSVMVNGPAIATPEPATMALACSGLGALGLAGLRRRLGRRRQQPA